MRQAFMTVAIDAFVRAEDAERVFLGRLSRGFFAFHSLGVFGEIARERIAIAKHTVWLLDSDTQIPALAAGHPTRLVARNVFERLKAAGVRLFTTESLFDETFTHVWFANKLVRLHGENSRDVAAAATAQPPYRKSNAFLEGFIRWRTVRNTGDFRLYMRDCFGTSDPKQTDVRRALEQLVLKSSLLVRGQDSHLQILICETSTCRRLQHLRMISAMTHIRKLRRKPKP